MFYANVDYGAFTKNALNNILGRLLDMLRRYEQQPNPSKYFMDRMRQTFRSSPADIRLIKRTLHFANQAHKGQTRLTGEPYILHSISAAVIIVEYLGIRDAIMVSGALGHDIKEDHEKIWTKWHTIWRINASVIAIVDWCNRNGFSEINDKQFQDDAFLSNILHIAPREVRIVKSAEKLHNNVTPAPEKLADAGWRVRKRRTIHKWYEPMTQDTGYLIDEMVASRVAIENGIRLIATP